MVTRGRESNRLYIDTTHESDAATAHCEVEHAEPIDVLKHVVATSGADQSAHEVRDGEQNPAWQIRRSGADAGTCAGTIDSVDHLTRRRPARVRPQTVGTSLYSVMARLLSSALELEVERD
jgi:hypothetical protein